MSDKKIDTSGILINSQEELDMELKVIEAEKEVDEIMKELEKLFEEIDWSNLKDYYEKKDD